MNQKRSALIFLLLVSFLIPWIEIQVTGKVDFFGKFGALEAGLSAIATYWWYHQDKQQISFRAGTFQNLGIVVFAVIALPVYFIRSRGWKTGSVAILKAFVFLIFMNVLTFGGEWVGGNFAL